MRLFQFVNIKTTVLTPYTTYPLQVGMLQNGGGAFKLASLLQYQVVIIVVNNGSALNDREIVGLIGVLLEGNTSQGRQ